MKLDRLALLARRQLHLPLRDFAFVGAMVAMIALSLTTINDAASAMIANSDQAETVIADPAANDNRPTTPVPDCKDQVVRPIRS